MNEATPGGPGRGPASGGPGWVAWLEHRLNLTEIFSFLSHFGVVYAPVDNTRPVGEVVREVARMPVPAYTRGPRVLGLLAVILFGLEVVTGVLLAYYYRPTPEAAFTSTRDIVRDLPLGKGLEAESRRRALLRFARKMDDVSHLTPEMYMVTERAALIAAAGTFLVEVERAYQQAAATPVEDSGIPGRHPLVTGEILVRSSSTGGALLSWQDAILELFARRVIGVGEQSGSGGRVG